jgi:hypothetical protein
MVVDRAQTRRLMDAQALGPTYYTSATSPTSTRRSSTLPLREGGTPHSVVTALLRAPERLRIHTAEMIRTLGVMQALATMVQARGHHIEPAAARDHDFAITVGGCSGI